MVPTRKIVALLLIGCVLMSCSLTGRLAGLPDQLSGSKSPGQPVPASLAVAREKIKHVVIIMQENRSFDHYFGTYKSPGGQHVDGIPRKPDGTFTVCNPNPIVHRCQTPYHSTNLYNSGGAHSNAAGIQAIDGGKMDGFEMDSGFDISVSSELMVACKLAVRERSASQASKPPNNRPMTPLIPSSIDAGNFFRPLPTPSLTPATKFEPCTT